MAVIDTLDTSRNSPYDSMTGIIGIKCLKAYTGSVEFKTYVDEKYTGHEQRRDAWSTPRREWVLEFEKTPANARALEDFFIRCRGKKRGFQWKWDRTMDGIDFGGDDNVYNVRFNVDKLDFKAMEMGYKTYSIPIIQLITWE